MNPVRLVDCAAVSVLLALSACSSGGGASPGAEVGPVFLAFAANFAGFHQWQSFDVTKDAAPGTVHPDAKLVEYLNKKPPHGSSQFPVGTIIVKEPSPLPTPLTPFFGMVKRGGGYNADGLDGWEWFELQNTNDGMDTVAVGWHGFGPPLGETYGGDPNAGCNTCHRDCGNDGVCAPAVRLSDF